MEDERRFGVVRGYNVYKDVCMGSLGGDFTTKHSETTHTISTLW